MKLVVGLGNPGDKYNNTRHNAGFLVLEKLQTEISKLQIPNSKQYSNLKFQSSKKFNSEILQTKDYILAKPQTFMNDTGIAVSRLSTFYKIHPADIYIIHDDLDIKLGEYKIQKSVGPKVHNGVNSIEEKLGSKEFWRIRVGIDNRGTENRIGGEDYVLQDFTADEWDILKKVAAKVSDEIKNII